jgi:hypothetical protein
MKSFKSIEELLKVLGREKELLKEMFAKRKSLTFRRDLAEDMVDGDSRRLDLLLEYGVLRQNAGFLELEETYLRFFEDVLQVNEEIAISSVKDYIDTLNEHIDYWLKETNPRRKLSYHRAVVRTLYNIAGAVLRSTIDLKRNVDTVYKNEPNYIIKKEKLVHLDQKHDVIKALIVECERVMNDGQKTFFQSAMDGILRQAVDEVRLSLNDAYHSLIEINRQILEYLNLIEYQNRLLQKIRTLKYLRDQLTITEYTDIRRRALVESPVWMDPLPRYRLKLSLDNLLNDEDALAVLKSVVQKGKTGAIGRETAGAIGTEFLAAASIKVEMVDQQEMFNLFRAQGKDLFSFVTDFEYKVPMDDGQKLVLFCQLATLYPNDIQQEVGRWESILMTIHEKTRIVEHPIIYPK